MGSLGISGGAGLFQGVSKAFQSASCECFVWFQEPSRGVLWASGAFRGTENTLRDFNGNGVPGEYSRALQR